jgi:superfamily II DNA or RNA helicase
MEPTLTLRDWQVRATDYFFENNKTALFNVPTGAGKTFVAIYILKKLIEEYPNLRTLIIAPKNVIIEKTWLPELRKYGYHLNNVGIYNGDFKEYSKITITTNASLPKINKKIFDFIIADEVHNMGTPKMLEVLNMDFKYKLGLSATVERSDYGHWKIFEAFNFKVFDYSMKSALKDEVLNKFNFYDVLIDLTDDERKRYDEITMAMGGLMKAVGGYHNFMALPGSNPNKLALMKLINKRKKIVWNNPGKLGVVAKICKRFYNSKSKIIIFSQFNETTNSLYFYLSSEGMKPVLVHSNLSSKDREHALKSFKYGKSNIMLATKILDEGYNLPKIDVGIILAGDSTQKQTIQRLGRVLRKKKVSSNLFQVYIRNTFESDVSEKRSIFFKELCEEYGKIEV